ncbi:MAG: hypothetical protein IKI63_06085 [Clostridia bacterium]|nr:hypothetical protein [Clostridia bacterium]
MRYYQTTENGYITAIGTGEGNREISEDRYREIMAIIQTKPMPGTGYDVRLKETDLTWELVETKEAIAHV